MASKNPPLVANGDDYLLYCYRSLRVVRVAVEGHLGSLLVLTLSSNSCRLGARLAKKIQARLHFLRLLTGMVSYSISRIDAMSASDATATVRSQEDSHRFR